MFKNDIITQDYTKEEDVKKIVVAHSKNQYGSKT